MAKGSGMKKVDVVHCKPMRMGGAVGGVANQRGKMPAPFKKGGMVVRGAGCAVKGKKFTGPNG